MIRFKLFRFHSDYFKSIQYTPLNEYYRPILSLCELLLSGSSLDLVALRYRPSCLCQHFFILSAYYKHWWIPHDLQHHCPIAVDSLTIFPSVLTSNCGMPYYSCLENDKISFLPSLLGRVLCPYKCTACSISRIEIYPCVRATHDKHAYYQNIVLYISYFYISAI